MTTRKPIVGIDLGTTYSLVSVLQNGKPVVLPNALGERLTPSVVSIDENDTVLVGAPARARATTSPQRTAMGFKRDMGTDRTYMLGNRSFRPQELSALVLGALKHDAEAALGESIEEAVITVPAYFGEIQRQATRDAGLLAGFKVDRIINEPTAAALAYGLNERHRELKAVVLDLGGGTFDVTTLEIMEGVIEIKSTAGDARLGGDDFDAALGALFADRIKQEHGFDLRANPYNWARVIEAAQAAKHRLSTDETTSMALFNVKDASGQGRHVESTITRAMAEAAWRPLIERVRTPIQRALRDAHLGPGDLDEVLLVGGSTRLPCIGQLSSELFGRLPLRTLPPDEAVSMGAAVQAALKAGESAVEDMIVTDVAPFTLGTDTSIELNGNRLMGVFSPIIERGTVIPASRTKRYSAISEQQTRVDITVFQGEHSLCTDNQKLGSYTVNGLRGRTGQPDEVDIRFTYDLNGLLEVETTIISTGKKETLLIEKQPGKLSAEEIRAARQALARLKLHPRDALPNAAAIERAEALHVELTGHRREELGRALAMFRAALEGQRPEEIQPLREQLVSVTSRLKEDRV